MKKQFLILVLLVGMTTFGSIALAGAPAISGLPGSDDAPAAPTGDGWVQLIDLGPYNSLEEAQAASLHWQSDNTDITGNYVEIYVSIRPVVFLEGNPPRQVTKYMVFIYGRKRVQPPTPEIK